MKQINRTARSLLAHSRPRRPRRAAGGAVGLRVSKLALEEHENPWWVRSLVPEGVTSWHDERIM